MTPGRALLVVLAWAAGIWLLLIAASLPLWPLQSSGEPPLLTPPEYQQPRPPSLFLDEVQEAVYQIGSHCPLPDRKRLVILGGSGSMAYWPALLQNATSADEVVNLSVFLSNFSQIRQVLADYNACVSDTSRRQTTYVLVPSMGSFLNLGKTYSAYEKEKLRSGLYAGEPDALKSRVPQRWLPAVINLWRPVVLMRLAGKKAKIAAALGFMDLRGRLTGKPARPPKPKEEDWLELIANRLPELGTDTASFAPEQSAELDQLVKNLRASGGTVIMAEQPIQTYLRNRSPAFPATHEALMAHAERLNIPYIDFSASADDSEFHDGLHANARGVQEWNRRLAEALGKLREADPAALGAVQ